MKLKTIKISNEAFDRAGACLSFTCAVHCLVSPFVIPLITGMWLKNFLAQTLENGIIVLSLLVATISFLASFIRHHGKSTPIYFFLAGGAVLLLRNSGGEGQEGVMTVAGTFLVMVSHMINLNLCRKCKHCH